MLTINVKPLRISLTFGFFFVLGITTLRDNSLGAWSLAFCIFHELGHLAAMLILKATVSEITFYGAGIKIISDGIGEMPKLRQAAVYISGPAVNLILAVVLSGKLSAINLFLGVLNLLPISYFDGGRLAALVFSEKRGVLQALSVASYIVVGAAMAAAIAQNKGIFEPSSLFYFAFMLMSYLLDA